VDDDPGQRSLLESFLRRQNFFGHPAAPRSGQNSGVVKISRDVHGDEK
jgi:hypothetical protein